jgi:serine phosphatase RsbU (regulator of sigma subunit)
MFLISAVRSSQVGDTLLLSGRQITFIAEYMRLMRVRSVAEAAQQAVLWPLPTRIGPVRITSLYLSAHEEAKIGGDLYAVARTASGTRLLIGDVRGNGLEAIRDAALLVGAFREASHRHSDLTGLSVTLEESLRRHSRESGDGLEDCEETFVTALLLDIPDQASVVQLSDFGHPPPLLIHNGQVTPLETSHTSPPLGMCWMAGAAAIQDVFPFEAGDTLLLYTDGVSEARNADGEFYPLSERVAGWTDRGPQEILSHLRQDLKAYAGGRVGDDAAILAVQRMP